MTNFLLPWRTRVRALSRHCRCIAPVTHADSAQARPQDFIEPSMFIITREKEKKKPQNKQAQKEDPEPITPQNPIPRNLFPILDASALSQSIKKLQTPSPLTPLPAPAPAPAPAPPQSPRQQGPTYHYIPSRPRSKSSPQQRARDSPLRPTSHLHPQRTYGPATRRRRPGHRRRYARSWRLQ